MKIGLKIVSNFSLLLPCTIYSFSFHSVPCLNRSEQALECEETAVASVAAAGPSDDAAAPGIAKFQVFFVCLPATHDVRYTDY